MSVVIGITANRAMAGDGDVTMMHYVAPEAYVKAVRRAGAVPVVLPIVDPDDHDGLRAALDAVAAVVVTGGPDVDPTAYGRVPEPRLGLIDRERDETDLAVVRALVERNQPTLCICRGVQVLNVALGGTLVQHLDDHMRLDRYNELVHDIDIEPGSSLSEVLGSRIGVNTLHHQCIDDVAPGARVVARAPDGTVEAIEVDGADRVLGVQWHPELLRHRPEHAALFAALARRGQDFARRSR